MTAGCPMVCECPAGPPSCPPGVSSVPDACSCCKVCAAQLNQDCHEGRPCDHHKGLECNYGNDVGRTHGICRGMCHRGAGEAKRGEGGGIGGSDAGGVLGFSSGLSEGMCNFRVGNLASEPSGWRFSLIRAAGLKPVPRLKNRAPS